MELGDGDQMHAVGGAARGRAGGGDPFAHGAEPRRELGSAVRGRPGHRASAAGPDAVSGAAADAASEPFRAASDSGAIQTNPAKRPVAPSRR